MRALVITVPNTPAVRAALRDVSWHVAFNMAHPGEQATRREAFESIAAAIDIALEPEQLTDEDQRTIKEIDHGRR